MAPGNRFTGAKVAELFACPARSVGRPRVPRMECSLEGRVDAKHGVVACDGFEGGHRCAVRDREVLTSTCSNLAPYFQDGRALLRREFCKHDRTRPAALDKRLPAGRAHVLHPL